jgi:hypothetical protein
MRDQLERDLRRLIRKFEADVRRTVLRALQAALVDPQLRMRAATLGIRW